MTYQVRRDSQMYGPYTLQDLQRYVASGNVLPTDLAKSDEMPDWLPVSQILNQTLNQTPGQQAPQPSPFPPQFPQQAAPGAGYAPNPYAANPYAAQPYGAPLATSPTSAFSDPPNLQWGIYLLLAIVTCTLFSKVYTVIQAVWLRRVEPTSNALFFYIGYYVLWFVSLIINVTVGLGTAFADHGSAAAFGAGTLLKYFLSLVSLILLLVTRYFMSRQLEQHFTTTEPLGVEVQPVLGVFFGGVYFQSVFNRVVELKQAGRYAQPPAF